MEFKRSGSFHYSVYFSSNITFCLQKFYSKCIHNDNKKEKDPYYKNCYRQNSCKQNCSTHSEDHGSRIFSFTDLSLQERVNRTHPTLNFSRNLFKQEVKIIILRNQSRVLNDRIQINRDVFRIQSNIYDSVFAFFFFYFYFFFIFISKFAFFRNSLPVFFFSRNYLSVFFSQKHPSNIFYSVLKDHRFLIRDYPFSTYAKFSEKLTFLTP